MESQNHLPILIDLGTTSYNSTNGERSRSICPLISFENHMATKISKANQMVGLIRRNFAFLNADLFRRPFIAFLRPHLEYAHPVWSPHLKKHIKNIERVQRRATKLIDGFKNLEYQERLLRLNLPTLAFRRLRGDMIEVYKHLRC